MDVDSRSECWESTGEKTRSWTGAGHWMTRLGGSAKQSRGPDRGRWSDQVPLRSCGEWKRWTCCWVNKCSNVKKYLGRKQRRTSLLRREGRVSSFHFPQDRESGPSPSPMSYLTSFGAISYPALSPGLVLVHKPDETQQPASMLS
jgi:hypothetical protein